MFVICVQNNSIYFFKSIGKEGKGIYIRKRVNIGLVSGVLKLVANYDYNWDSPQKRTYLPQIHLNWIKVKMTTVTN